MLRWFAALMVCAQAAFAQVAVDPDRTAIRDGWWTLEVAVGLDAITPYRVYTLDAPRRLVVDFADVQFDGLSADDLIDGDRATAVRFGPLRPGWARMVIDLAEPLVVTEAGMTGRAAGADLLVVLARASPEEFAQNAGAPPDPGWDVAHYFDPAVIAEVAQSDGFVVVIDPGHGGLDPGALQGGIKEADLMLAMARELAGTLNDRPGLRALLTRDADLFVPLSARLTFARDVGADLFISLHADALDTDTVRGASVYTLSSAGGDAAAQRSVERHERGDVLAGVDLTGTEDRVATVLMDLARARTQPVAQAFANTLVAEMANQGVHLNTRPLRQGQFAVLTAAAFPSVLIEAGFLSNARDRAILSTQAGRTQINHAIRDAIFAMMPR